MRAVLQRVIESRVVVDGQVVGEIGPGWLVLLGVGHGDTLETARWVAEKCVHLRGFNDDAGKMNRSVQDIQGECLLVSQFTLMADSAKGNRPGYSRAAAPAIAEPLFHQFLEICREGWPDRIQSGVFGADMQITLLNDGPVTIWMDSRDRSR